MSEIGMPRDAAPGAGADRAAPDPRRWLILATIGLAQLMIVLDLTVVNIALPSAQRSLHFATVDRQWVVTAYALAFGSLLLLGGRLADLLGRKVTFMAGLAGFAVVSAVGGASVSFVMLVTARACQGAFAAIMAPSALSILTNTFQDPKDRGKAFGVFKTFEDLCGGGSVTRQGKIGAIPLGFLNVDPAGTTLFRPQSGFRDRGLQWPTPTKSVP